MAKLIKVTDEVGELLSARAESDGVSLAGEIKLLLDGKDSIALTNTIDKRLDKMGKWLDKKFEDLEAAFNLAVMSSGSSTSSSASKLSRDRREIKWWAVQEVMFDVLVDSDAWLAGKEEAARSSDNLDMGTFFSDGDVIYSDDAWGRCDWFKVTPEVKQAFKERGYDV